MGNHQGTLSHVCSEIKRVWKLITDKLSSCGSIEAFKTCLEVLKTTLIPELQQLLKDDEASGFFQDILFKQTKSFDQEFKKGQEEAKSKPPKERASYLEMLMKVLPYLANLANILVSLADPLLESLTKYLMETSKWLGEILSSALEWISSMLHAIKDYISDAFDTLCNYISYALRCLWDTIVWLGKGIYDGVCWVATQIKETIVACYQGVKWVVEKVCTFFKNTFCALVEAIWGFVIENPIKSSIIGGGILIGIIAAISVALGGGSQERRK